jgi:hypothetical protein
MRRALRRTQNDGTKPVFRQFLGIDEEGVLIARRSGLVSVALPVNPFLSGNMPCLPSAHAREFEDDSPGVALTR